MSDRSEIFKEAAREVEELANKMKQAAAGSTQGDERNFWGTMEAGVRLAVIRLTSRADRAAEDNT